MTLLFKSPERHGAEFEQVHPDLQACLTELDTWSTTQNIHRPVITCLVRTREEDAQLYVDRWRNLTRDIVRFGVLTHDNEDTERKRTTVQLNKRRTMRRLLHRRNAGVDLELKVIGGNLLNIDEREKVRELLTLESLTQEAMERFTWHFPKCAADLRIWHYQDTELSRVQAWLQARTKGPGWECLLEPEQDKPHLHLARKDLHWRQLYETKAGEHGLH